jgi:predicted phosphoribosyltransferase
VAVTATWHPEVHICEDDGVELGRRVKVIVDTIVLAEIVEVVVVVRVVPDCVKVLVNVTVDAGKVVVIRLV